MTETAQKYDASVDPGETPTWSITPSFILRRSAISDVTKGWKHGEFLECGTGTGKMTSYFLDRGFTGCGYDLTVENLTILNRNLATFGNKFRTTDNLATLSDKKFEYLFAFEVLEHVAEDTQALAQWTSYLKQDGLLLISIPARMKFFRADDHHAGHVRRYEKSELKTLLEKCGYRDITIYSYGVPLLNLSRRVGALLHSKENRNENIMHTSQTERSIKSGVERISPIHKVSRLFNDTSLLPFRMIQKLFYRFDLGEGYVVTARKA